MKNNITIYSLNDLIDILGVTRPTVIKYIKQKKIKAFKIGNSWRVTEEALREYIRNSEKHQ